MLDSALRNQLAKKLRDIHADIEAAEIPPRIARLLGEPPDDRPPRAPPVNEFLGVTTNLLKKLKRQSDTSHEIEPPTPSLRSRSQNRRGRCSVSVLQSNDPGRARV